MAVSPTNRLRFRMVLLSRSAKELFAAPVPRGRLYNWLFRNEAGELRRVGEHVLADLREFARLPGNHAGATVFDTDPLVMARRVGRQEVAMRIINLLNLDEQAVQKLMEIDDGLE